MAQRTDSTGNIYVTTGNGTSDVTASSGPTNDDGDCVLKLSSGLAVPDWFMLSDEVRLAGNDLDFSAAGAAVVLNLPTGPFQHLVLTGGKDGVL